MSRAWGLPVVFQDTIAHHHRDGCDYSAALELVHLACALADAFMFESIPYRSSRTPIETVQTCVPERIHKDLTGTLERLKLAAFEAIESFDF